MRIRSFKITAVVFIILGLTGCYNADIWNTVRSLSDAEYFNIVSVSPAANEDHVQIDASIRVHLDDVIDIATVTGGSFYVRQGGTPIAGTFGYDNVTKILSFTPSANMGYGLIYTVTITTGIKNLVGETIRGDFSWSFTTIAPGQPDINLLQGGAPVISGDTIDFSITDVGSSKPLVFKIENLAITSGDLDISSISVSGTDSSQFLLTIDPSPTTLGPGTSVNFTIEFTPTSIGVKYAEINILNSDSGENPYLVFISGTAIAAGTAAPEIEVWCPNCMLSDNGLYPFGTYPPGSSSPDIPFTIKNTGTDVLNVTDIIMQNSAGGVYIISSAPSVPFILNPGMTATFSVRFSPVSTGVFFGEVRILNDDADENPFNIRLKAKSK